MANPTVTLHVVVNSSGVGPGISRVRNQLQGLGSAGQQTGQQLGSAMTVAASATASLSSGIGTLRSVMATLGVATVVRELLSAGIAMSRFETMLTASIGSQRQASAEMQFLRFEAERLGLYLPTLVQGYASLAAATRGGALEGQKTRDIFIAVAEAGRAMNLSNEAIAGTLTALQQIASKGTVSMEELRQQLGDRLPGAIQLAAKAMGVTTGELIKLVSEGKVASDEFLPKFAAELRRANAAGVEFARSRPAAEFERLRTAIFESLSAISGDVLLQLAEAARTLAQGLNSLVQSGVMASIGSGLAGILSLTDELLVSIVAFYGIKGILGLIAGWQNMIKTMAATSAAYEMMGIQVNSVATAKRNLMRQGTALFTAMGGWVTVLSAVVVGLYALYQASVEDERQRNAETYALLEVNKQLEEQINLRRLLAEGKANEGFEAQAAALDKEIQLRDRLLAQYERIAVYNNIPLQNSGLLGGGNTAKVRELEKDIKKANDALEEHFRLLILDGQQVPPAYQAMADEARKYADICVTVVTAMATFNNANSKFIDQTGAAVEAQLNSISVSEALTEQEVALVESLESKVRTLGASQIAVLEEEKAQALATASNARARQEIEQSYNALIRKTAAVEAATKAETERQEALRAATQLWEQEQRAYERSQFNRELAARELRDGLRSLQEENQLIGLNADQRERLIAAMEVEKLIRESGDALSKQEAQNLREQIDVQIQLNQAKQQSADLADSYRDRWIGVIDEVSNAFGDLIVGNIKSFSDFGDELVDIAKRFVAQIISEMAKIQIAKWLSGSGGSLGAAASNILRQYGVQAISGGSPAGGGVVGAAGGSGGSINYSSLLSQTGYGASLAQLFASPVSGLYNSYMAGEFSAGFVGPPQYLSNGTAGGGIGNASLGGITGGLAGAYYGAQNRNSTGSRIAAGASYGALGFAAGTGIAAGVAAGSVSAGVSAGAGAFSALGGATWIPIVGWILAIAALIDLASGGKLFGTSFRPESMTSELSIGALGASASTELTEVRQRSLFRGRQWRTSSIAPGEEALEAASSLWEAVNEVMVGSARQLRAEAPPVIDAAIRTVIEFDKKGREKSRKILVDVIGRTWEEATAELAATRISAEAIIATIDSVLGTTVEQTVNSVVNQAVDGFDGLDLEGLTIDGPLNSIIQTTTTFVNEASNIAERWRSDAEELLAGAQFLLVVATDFRNGARLLGEAGSLTQITDLVEDLQRGEESLIDTYVRVREAAQLLDDAIRLTGVTFDATREQIVRFAVDIADAAGGIERASQLWSTFFQAFYSEAELAVLAGDQLLEYTRSQFSDIGLNFADFDGEGGMAAFRELFESRLPTLSADAVVQWLEAAEALATYVQRQDEATAATLRAIQAQMQAIFAYEELAQEVRDELMESNMSEFAIELRNINRWTDDVIGQLNAAAQAAGFQAAAEEDLAAVHQVAANRAAAAIARLRNAASQLVNELYGSPLDRINEQISAMESMYSSQIDGINSVGQAAQDMYQAQVRALSQIQQWLDRQLLSNLSTLTPAERVAEARSQFEALLARAQAGDTEAMSQITEAANALLTEGRSYFASSLPYTELEAFVRTALSGLVAAGPTINPSDPNTGSTGGGGPVYSRELEELYQQRDALLAEQENARRLEILTELGRMIRELIQATGEPLAEVAASIGLNLTELAADLGINLDELTAETAINLVNLARQLGVDVAELAENVGISLGSLGDRQSLLNQALDNTLELIPEEFRNQIIGPLEDLRTATNEADANAAIDSLTTVSRGFPASIRDLLAPYFQTINPSQVVTELGTLRTISSIGQEQLQVLNDILSELRVQGQSIENPDVAPDLPEAGGIGGPKSTSTETTDELLRQVIQKLDSLERTTANGSSDLGNEIRLMKETLAQR